MSETGPAWQYIKGSKQHKLNVSKFNATRDDVPSVSLCGLYDRDDNDDDLRKSGMICELLDER